MPRRSITSTEKAAETTPVERRSTRASTRKSVEGTPDVAASTPEKQKTEKSPVVKSSPAQGKRGRPSKRQSAAAVEENEQTAVEETKMDVDTVNDKDVAKAVSEPEAEKVEETATNSAEKSEVKEDSTGNNAEAEKVESQEELAENKKRQREEDKEEASVKKHRPEEGADQETEVTEKKEETSVEGAKEATKESSGDVEGAGNQEESSLATSNNGDASEPKVAEPEATKEETVTEVPSKKALVSDSEVVQTAEDSTKQNGCHETAAEPTAHVGC